MSIFRIFILTTTLLVAYLYQTSYAQVAQKMLLTDMKVQIEATQAVNDMYNFKYAKAERQFRWLKQKYAWHPLPYFLLGLSEWWKIMPNNANKSYDEKFLNYMDTTIVVAKHLYKQEEYQIESAFFLAAAYGFKGRLYSTESRKRWRKAATAGKNALKYLEVSKGNHDLSPELLFGDALYNYFSVWIPENYPLLKPILLFFPKGDKSLGLDQLRKVSRYAFYTRTEAQVFLMRILNNFENDKAEALQVGEYLYNTFPDNAYFHRYYARLLYSSGRFSQCLRVSENIIAKLDSSKIGYEANSGRYASFFLAQIHEYNQNTTLATTYYQKTIHYAESIQLYKSGYYLYSLLYLGQIQWEAGNKSKAKSTFKKLRKNAKRSHSTHKLMREYIKKSRQ